MIELIAVVGILGTLSAIAIPKYVEMARQSRLSMISASIGAIQQALNVANMQTQLGGTAGSANSTVVIAGQTVNVKYGWPQGIPSNILKVVDLSGYFVGGTYTDEFYFDIIPGCGVHYRYLSSDAVPLVTPNINNC